MADPTTPTTTTTVTATVTAPEAPPQFWSAIIRLWRSSKAWAAIVSGLLSFLSELAANWQTLGLSPMTGHVLAFVSLILGQAYIHSTAAEDIASKTPAPTPASMVTPAPDSTKTTTVTVAPASPTSPPRAVS